MALLVAREPYFRFIPMEAGETSTRVRVRLSPEALAVAEANANSRGLTFGEFIRIILTTPAPIDASWSDIGEEIDRRLKEAARRH